MSKKELLREAIRHIDITKIDSRPIIDAMRGMSFSSRDTANAADILNRMLGDAEYQCSRLYASVRGYGTKQYG